ncbi:MAG: putative quorum-sensing-regulated virulence factor [Bacteroidota bacterium]
MVLRVIDIETTGLDPMADAIVEIASVDLTKEGGITNPQQTFVFPDQKIPALASAVHHIVDDDVREAPRLREALALFEGADCYIAHNCSFERSFLDPILGRQAWLCTFKCALRIWPDFVEHNLQALRYQLGIVQPFGRPRQEIVPHRAASDTIVTAAIAHVIMRQARWSDLMRWSQEPAHYTRLTFGKHRGQKLADVPVDYLDWMLKSDLEADWKLSAKAELERRQKERVA